MLLALDTSSPTVAVAVLDDDGSTVRSDLVSEQAMRHGEQLAPMLERALAEAGATRFDVRAVAVGVGPGPFTGLRVGLVSARTLGAILDVPVYGVCSLDVLAVEAVARGPRERGFAVTTDARRREVFWAAYDADGVRLDGPAVGRPDDVAALLAPGTDVVGEGAALYPDVFPRRSEPLRPRAAHLALAVAGEMVELLDPDPWYLRRPDAEIPGAPKPVS